MNDQIIDNTNMGFAHHGLRVYGDARRLVRMVGEQPIHNAELRNQAMRASTSVALNIAEGAGQVGAAKKRHYKIARASLTEVVACYELARDLGETAKLNGISEQARIIGCVLTKLIRR